MDRHTHELEILNAIAEALNATNDVRVALERTLALATELLGLQSGWVWLLDAETNQLYSAAAYNLPPYLQEPVRMSGTWCLCTDALRSGGSQSENVDVIECSRLSPAVRKREIALTAGIRYHASVALRFQDKPLGVMNVTGPSWRKLTVDELRLLSTVALQTGAMIERSRLADDEARLARAEERTRLARELHDTLLQSLTAIALQLESAAKSADDPIVTRNHLQRTLETARNAAIDARRAVADLRPAPLQGKPLSQALRSLARSFTSETGVRATVNTEARLAIPERAEAELYRIAREALTNVGRHARAQAVAITLKRAKGMVELTVADDGGGLDERGASSGHGMQGMGERAALLGGILATSRRRGGGTKITATVPLTARSR